MITPKAIILLMIAIALVFPSWHAVAAPAQSPAEVIELINTYRAENNLPAYTEDSTLMEIAQDQADHQADIENVTHVGAGGTDVSARARAAGYGGGVTPQVNEMVYGGLLTDPQVAFNWWKNSEVHNGIMLSLFRHQIGVGQAISASGRTYFAVVVGSIPGVTSAGALSPTRTSTPTRTAAPIETSLPGPDGSILHLVKSGETLAAIAAAYGVSQSQLRLNNDIGSSEEVSAGDILVIKEPGTPSANTATATPARGNTDTPEPTEGGQVVPATTEAVQAATPTETETSGGVGPVTTATIIVTPAEPAGPLRNPTVLWAIIGVLLLIVAVESTLLVLQARGEEGFQFNFSMPGADARNEARSEQRKEAFEALSYQEQFAALEELAKNALKEYDLDVVEITPLQYRLNASFMVEARPKGDLTVPVERFLLRINAPRFQSEAHIRSEAQWLQALHKQTDLLLHDPVQNVDGDLVVTAHAAKVPEPRHVVLFRWIQGNAAEEITTETMEKVGEMMAKLHKQAAAYDPPPGFTRRSWDLAGLTGENLDVPLEQAEDALTPAQLDILADTSHKVEEVMQSLGDGPEVFGLIHGDLHEKNYIFTPYGTVGAIDFDTCGWGYFVYDLAVTLSTLLQRQDLAELKNALVRGYRRERQLSTTHENLIIPFVAGRLLINTLWVAGHSQDRDLREAAPKVIERQIKFLEKFLGR